jgi:hypothetical protein
MRKENTRLIVGLAILVLFAISGLFAPLTLSAEDNSSSEANTCSQDRYTDESGAMAKMVNTIVVKDGDLNENGISADAGDLAMLKDIVVGKFKSDRNYDLNDNGIPADAGDLAILKDAATGKIELL